MEFRDYLMHEEYVFSVFTDLDELISEKDKAQVIKFILKPSER